MSRTLVHMLHDSVQKWPESDAVVLSENKITYRELWETSLTLANFLCANDFKSNDRIAILIENSPEYVEIYYATQAAGGIAEQSLGKEDTEEFQSRSQDHASHGYAHAFHQDGGNLNEAGRTNRELYERERASSREGHLLSHLV